MVHFTSFNPFSVSVPIAIGSVISNFSPNTSGGSTIINNLPAVLESGKVLTYKATSANFTTTDTTGLKIYVYFKRLTAGATVTAN